MSGSIGSGRDSARTPTGRGAHDYKRSESPAVTCRHTRNSHGLSRLYADIPPKLLGERLLGSIVLHQTPDSKYFSWDATNSRVSLSVNFTLHEVCYHKWD